MKAYVGIDLHSTNNYVGIINQKDKRLFQKRLPNNLDEILKKLRPFKKQIDGIAIETRTFPCQTIGDRHLPGPDRPAYRRA